MATPIRPFSAKLGGATGISPYKAKVERHLSDLREYFSDRSVVEQMLLRGENPLIYEVYEVPQEPVEGMFNVGCTVLHPGTIGGEYYFTMGHFHKKESTSEVYVGMDGKGLVLIQNHEEKTTCLEIKPDILVYITPRTAHRTINTGKDRLVFLAIYPSEAGHDYESIRTKGFGKLVIEKNGKTAIIDNPDYALR